MNIDEFAKFLLDETPRFDEKIMEGIRQKDDWIGVMHYGEQYLITLSAVRFISENAVNSIPRMEVSCMPMGTPSEITQDRFKNVWSNTTKRKRK